MPGIQSVFMHTKNNHPSIWTSTSVRKTTFWRKLPSTTLRVFTLPKTDIPLENKPSPKRQKSHQKSSPNHHFSTPLLVFWGRNYHHFTTSKSCNIIKRLGSIPPPSMPMDKLRFGFLGGGFNPLEKNMLICSNWIMSPRFGVKIRHLWNHHLVNKGLGWDDFPRKNGNPPLKLTKNALEKWMVG